MARCECAACGKVFKSLTGFDAHRVGEFDNRRCLSDEELETLGYTKKDNVWQGQSNPRFTVAQ